MIDPSSLVPVTLVNTEEYNVLNIKNVPPYTSEDYDMMDPKEFKSYIKDLERVVRTSFEYSQMIAYLRENLDMNKCSFFENVIKTDGYSNIRIEIHHSPFTLYDIANTVYNKRCALRESTDIEMVAKEVMYLHYTLMVGLIPLSETVHELVHNQYMFIPVQKVMGNYESFFQNYEPYITPDVKDTFNRIIEYSKTYDESTQNAALSKSYLYLDIEGRDNQEEFKNTLDLMNDRIDSIKKQREDAIFNNNPA